MAETRQRNVRIDQKTWDDVMTKCIRLDQLSPDAVVVTASYVVVKSLQQFLAETDEESLARLGLTAGADA